MLDKIKAEIQKVLDAEGDSENARAQALALFWVLELLDKHAEQEPCDDAISRQAVLDINESHHGQMPNHINYQIWQEIKELPSVRPQEQTGHWIRITNCAMKEKYICSKCGRQIEDDGIEGLLPIKYPYCHCGAKMVEQRETETWHGIHAQITAPKGTFEQIFNEADDDYDI